LYGIKRVQAKLKKWLNNNSIFLGVAVIGFTVFFPALGSFFIGDDFYILALCKYIDSPLYLFSDHFPFSLYYRPIALVLEWFLIRLSGLNNYIHYFANFFIHLASAYVLYKILLKLSQNILWSSLFASLFLLHPVTISTTLWMSNRFDTLATLFVLCLVFFTIKYIEDYKRKYFIYSLLATVLAILSKEIGYSAAIVATVILIAFPGGSLNVSARMILLFSQYLITFVLITIRYIVLNKLAGSYFDGSYLSLLANLIKGYYNWLKNLPEYLLYYNGVGVLGNGAKLFFLVVLACCLVLILYFLFKKNLHFQWHIFLFGIFLVLFPGVVVSPVTSTYAFPSPVAYFQLDAVFSSRFYYLSFVGLTISLCQLATSIVNLKNHDQKYSAKALILLTPVLILLYAATSRSIAANWAEYTSGTNRQVIEVAARAVNELKSPKGYKIYILNAGSHAFFIDVAIKSMASTTSGAIDCYIQTEKLPPYYIVPTELSQETDFAPLEQVLKPITVGNLTLLYLKIPKDNKGLEAVVSDERAIFLEFINQEIFNVTEAVRSGERAVQFDTKAW